MAYNASEFLKALEPPTLTVPRNKWWHYVFGIRQILGPEKTYTGRILSHPKWAPLQARWLALQNGETPGEEAAETLIRDTCDAIGIPANVVLNLPGRAMMEALNDFLGCQFRAHLPSGTKTPETTRHSPPATASRNGSPKKMNEHGMLVT